MFLFNIYLLIVPHFEGLFKLWHWPTAHSPDLQRFLLLTLIVSPIKFSAAFFLLTIETTGHLLAQDATSQTTCSATRFLSNSKPFLEVGISIALDRPTFKNPLRLDF